MSKEIVEQKKMTLEEYEQKYSHPENVKAAKSFLFIFTTAIGLIIFSCLFFIVLKLFDIHQIAGYVGAVIALLIFIFSFIVPVYKLKNTKAFITNVNAMNARQAKKYNKELREEIADKMIDFTSKTEGVGWYNSTLVGKLAIARQTKNDEDLKATLTEIYKTDVKKVANKMIRDHAFKVGFTTALSQSEKLDTLFITVYELKLIKDIVFLYGYRPSDAKLAKIYRTVIVNSITAYGLNSASTGISGVIKKASDAATGIPLLGQIIGTVVESSLQGVINSSLTVVIGFQTKKYLKDEYKLQDILDNVELPELDDDEEEAKMMAEVKEEFSKTKKEKKPVCQTA